MTRLAQSWGAEFKTLTPARGLVWDGKRVVGVKAENEAGEEVYFKANKAVILHCGDFSYNRDMLLRFTPKLGVGARGLCGIHAKQRSVRAYGNGPGRNHVRLQ